MGDADEETSPCPICLRAPMRRPLKTNCEHDFCGRCVGEHLWRSRGVRGVGVEPCPVCREPLRTLKEVGEGEGEAVVRAKFRHQEWQLCVAAGETCWGRLASAFDVPEGRLKVIHRGRMVQGEEALRVLAEAGARVQAIGGRAGDEALGELPLPARWAERSWLGLQGALRALGRACSAAFGGGALHHAREVLSVLIQSLSPSFKRPPVRGGVGEEGGGHQEPQEHRDPLFRMADEHPQGPRW